MIFTLRKALSLEEREAVKESLASEPMGSCWRFGSERRFIDVQFICDGTTDIVRVERSDGATAEGVIEHANELQIVSVLEQVKAQALAWAEGSN